MTYNRAMAIRTARRAKVLLTGFGPFPGVRRNLSAALARKLAIEARSALPDLGFAAAVLPTEWARAPRILRDLYEQHDPLLTLHFGVASGAQGFRIETLARNVCRMSADAAGQLPAALHVVEDAGDRNVTLDAKSLVVHLKDCGIRASLSDDAGGYLCNAILYHSLCEAERRGGLCRVGFVHVTAHAAQPDDRDRLVSGALEILKSAAAGLRSGSVFTSA
jgi:pyroglutamyl-peptidase